MTDKPLWSGRFAKAPSQEIAAFTSSLHFDIRLWEQDVASTGAHVRALHRAGILTSDELKDIEHCLADAAELFRNGEFELSDSDEDIHSVLERFLTNRLGDTGAKVHAGRSRNDLVVSDLRLWLKSAIPRIARGLHEVQESLYRQAREQLGVVVPGYTHLQRGIPILLSHHLLAHAFALARDFERMVGSYRRADVSVLGASALGGTTLPIDPAETARDLGFSKLFDNSADAVSDRDFALEFLAACAIAGVHLSRLGEEIVLWTSSEFAFAQLDDAFATGSSIMPNKKNPDLAELSRAKSARLSANLVHLLGVMKGLPLTYDRDLQEDKEPVFDTADTMIGLLGALKGLIITLRFDVAKMASAAGEGFLSATDFAEWLVTRGVPFRQAHEAVGRLVGSMASKGQDFSALTVEDLQGAHPVFEAEALALIDPLRSVALRTSHGGTAPQRVAEQIAKLELVMDDQKRWLEAFGG